VNLKEIKGVFVVGRQHSGNTFLTRILGSNSSFFMDENENSWFEYIPVIEKEKSLSNKVKLSTQHLLRGKPDVANKHLTSFQNWAEKNPQHSIYGLFLNGMQQVTKAEKKQYWVLKATSYIFYAEEILNNCPNVKLIYIMRNPLDLTASTKKRSTGNSDWLISTNLAWRQGVAIAQQLQDKYPSRFLIVQYENLVRETTTFKKISDFLGVELSSDYNDMPVVNTSDQPYKTTQQKGLKTNRVFYFSQILSSSEIALASRLAGGADFIQQHYPEIDIPTSSLFKNLAILPLATKMFFHFGKKHLNIFSVHKFNRVLRRLRFISNKN